MHVEQQKRGGVGQRLLAGLDKVWSALVGKHLVSVYTLDNGSKVEVYHRGGRNTGLILPNGCASIHFYGEPVHYRKADDTLIERYVIGQDKKRLGGLESMNWIFVADHNSTYCPNLPRDRTLRQSLKLA